MGSAPRLQEAFLVRRTLLLPALDQEALERAAQTLRAIEPIAEVRIGKGRLYLRYDASCVGFADIERLLSEAGVPLPQGFGWRWRAAWYRFLDANARSNALSRGGACCSRPPSPWPGRDEPGGPEP